VPETMSLDEAVERLHYLVIHPDDPCTYCVDILTAYGNGLLEADDRLFSRIRQAWLMEDLCDGTPEFCGQQPEDCCGAALYERAEQAALRARKEKP